MPGSRSKALGATKGQEGVESHHCQDNGPAGHVTNRKRVKRELKVFIGPRGCGNNGRQRKLRMF